ncbi:MAG: hypothetical protein M3M91_04950, partial [Thermoproteota archaeon]|nr:hypothetical protein [Thermoproteota archaeon]
GAILSHEKERYGYSSGIDAGDTVFIDQKKRRKALITDDLYRKPDGFMESIFCTKKPPFKSVLKLARAKVANIFEIFSGCI